MISYFLCSTHTTCLPIIDCLRLKLFKIENLYVHERFVYYFKVAYKRDTTYRRGAMRLSTILVDEIKHA